jgi:putative PIN family toxin of toxin-antitoxin system
VRVVLDVNVLVSALLSPDGAPARILVAWVDGAFELVVSPLLLAELERVLAYPKISKRIPSDDANRFVTLIAEQALAVSDPDADPPVRSPDPGDDYLIALAAAADALLVSGDAHLVSLMRDSPIHTPAQLADRLGV